MRLSHKANISIIGGGMTDHIYTDPDFVQFYDIENQDRADFEYCIGLARDAATVLDLDCGTGQLAAEMVEGRRVTGVDPASAMLDVARRRIGGDKVEWVEADARTVRLRRRFDLVLLTGHAFQVFVTEGDQRAVLRSIAEHLTPLWTFRLRYAQPRRKGVARMDAATLRADGNAPQPWQRQGLV